MTHTITFLCTQLFLKILRPPIPTLFPYTTLFRSRTVSKVDEFLNKEAKGTKVIGARSIEEMVQLLKKPRRIMLMVKAGDRKSTRLNSSHTVISYAVFCWKKKRMRAEMMLIDPHVA